MAIRDHDIAAPKEFFHCYNRGTDKRLIFSDQQDYVYFLKSLRAYNTEHTTGKLRLSEQLEKQDGQRQPLVNIVTYCLLPNHYHLVLENVVDGGISKYLQRVSTGYTMYFNKKYGRSGSLFQGKFKSKHIASDQDLKQIIAYVYLNHRVHNLIDEKLFRSSLNTKLDIVRGLASNLDEMQTNFNEIVDIIKLLRLDPENA